MALNNPTELSDRDSAAHIRVAQKENPSTAQTEILRSMAGRNRPDDSAEYIADEGARGRCAIVRANQAMPSEDCKVHALVRRQLHRCSAGVDVNALTVHLDQKRKRFSADPVGGALRRLVFADPAFAAASADRRLPRIGRPAKAADQMALCRTTDRVSRITREFSMDRFGARRRVLLPRRMKRRRVWQDRHWMPMLRDAPVFLPLQRGHPAGDRNVRVSPESRPSGSCRTRDGAVHR